MARRKDHGGHFLTTDQRVALYVVTSHLDVLLARDGTRDLLRALWTLAEKAPQRFDWLVGREGGWIDQAEAAARELEPDELAEVIPMHGRAAGAVPTPGGAA